VSGRAVARELAEMLAPVGIPVERVAIYDAVPASVLPEMLTAALYARTVDGVLFFSARTAETFGTLMMTSGLDSLSGGIAALCLSEAVGRTARILKWSVVAVAERPDSRSMLALLPAIMQASTHG
jgi:uroporphyrinogen-III synthase